MKNKLLPLIAAASLIISAPVYSAGNDDSAADSALSNEISVLHGLGIADDETVAAFDGYRDITRDEFAFMTANLAGYGARGGDYSGGSSFSDVKAGSGAGGRIEYLKNLQIVNGIETGLFGTESSITLNDASAMIVRLLGYETEVQRLTPGNYLPKAYELGIIAGSTKAGAGESITWTDAVHMIYNALDTQMMIRIVNGSTDTLTTKEDVNPLTYYLKCDVTEGIITANSRTRLDSPEESAIGTVTLGGVSYSAGETNAEDYLGYRVKLYYDDSDSNYEAKAVIPYRTNTRHIEADDIDRYTNQLITYYPDEYNAYKRETAKISRTADFIYNTTAYPGYTKDDILIDDGYIDLIDNNDDGTFDVIMVSEFKSYVAEAVYKTGNAVYLRGIQGSVSLDEKDFSSLRFFDADEEPATFGDINEQSVVTFVKDKTGRYLDVYICDNRLSGTITAVSEDRVEIDYIPREYNKSFYEKLKTLGSSFVGEFLLDFRGRITGTTEEVSTSMRYGYYSALYTPEDDETDVNIRIFTTDAKLEDFKAADRLTVDGEGMKKEDLMSDSRFILSSGNTKYNLQLIKYTTNAEGKVNSIITEYSPQSTKLSDDEKITKVNLSGIKYKAGTKIFVKKTYLTNNTLVFKVPSQNSTDFPLKAYSLNKETFADNVSYDDIYAYDIDDGGEAKVIVRRVTYVSSDDIGGADTPADEAACVMVKNVFMTLNSEDEPVPAITIVQNGSELTLTAANDNVLKKPVINESGTMVSGQYKYVEKGDILKYVTNSSNEISGIEVCHDISRTDAGAYKKSSGEICGFDYGKVYSKGRSGFRMSSAYVGGEFDFSEENLTIFPITNVPVTVYDMENDEIRSGTLNDIIDYVNGGEDASMAFARSKYYEIRELFIIQKQR